MSHYIDKNDKKRYQLTPRHFFRGMMVLLVLTLCGYGIYFMVEQINNKNDVKTYLSKADTAFVRTSYVDSTSNATKVKIYPKREFKPLNIELNSADTTQLKKSLRDWQRLCKPYCGVSQKAWRLCEC